MNADRLHAPPTLPSLPKVSTFPLPLPEFVNKVSKTASRAATRNSAFQLVYQCSNGNRRLRAYYDWHTSLKVPGCLCVCRSCQCVCVVCNGQCQYSVRSTCTHLVQQTKPSHSHFSLHDEPTNLPSQTLSPHAA